ncbi:PREDICTED: uncharacterized protein LOC109182830 [Ipomoea nil]|uniref:uncharacterized protein LOC109182830 n=1 Tax=Ipomoea nil TaxID=35883 RepID=UPI0009010C72|nr:PREDICTED: uncharacterized protein LOC109182830 [Ipomoea nil]XP_019188587.1 PREDICTED: uncharacterized protein LOC109182830 [Ipomoea nil]
MVKRDRVHISNLLKHWRGLFGRVRHTVTASLIADEVRAEVDGGDWFKRHFAMLVVSTLVSCMTNRYANQMYFDCFDDVLRIHELNWCKLLLDSLVETHDAWKSGRHRCFVGPAEFVALFYVDRVVPFERSVPRLVPSLVGWTTELLSAREPAEISAGGFGRGVVEPPILGVNVDGDGAQYGPKTFECVVGEEFALLSSSVVTLSELVRMVRGRNVGFELCQRMYATIQPKLRDLEQDLRTISEPDCLDDNPSFSLGLTQLFGKDGLHGRYSDTIAAVVTSINSEHATSSERGRVSIMDAEFANEPPQDCGVGGSVIAAGVVDDSNKGNASAVEIGGSGSGVCPTSVGLVFSTPVKEFVNEPL